MRRKNEMYEANANRHQFRTFYIIIQINGVII